MPGAPAPLLETRAAAAGGGGAGGGGLADWEEAYEAVEVLEESGLLGARQAAKLRKWAAGDDAAMIRVFGRNRAKAPTVCMCPHPSTHPDACRC